MYQIARMALPLKILAVRSELASYGKNNISYIPGMGSFYRLIAFYSDFPCQEDIWLEPQMMKHCHNCSACLDNCPTGAITSGGFLLHAERCITFHNERKLSDSNRRFTLFFRCGIDHIFFSKSLKSNG